MLVKINLDKSSEIVNCEKIEITSKFLKLTNVKFNDLVGGTADEKNYKLVSVISYEVIEGDK